MINYSMKPPGEKKENVKKIKLTDIFIINNKKKSNVNNKNKKQDAKDTGRNKKIKPKA